MDEQLKRWKCENGHMMGMVRRNGSGIRQLWLFRESVNSEQSTVDGEEGVDVMAIVEGYVADVRCSICGSVRTWVPGEEALRRMLERRGETGRGNG